MRKTCVAACAMLLGNAVAAAAPSRVHAQEYPGGYYFASHQGKEKTPPPPPAHGVHAAEIMRLRSHMDSLGGVMQAYYVQDSIVDDSVRRANRGRRHTDTGPDTIPVGPFRVIGIDGYAQRLAPSFEHAWTQMAPAFKGMEDDVKGASFVVMYYERQSKDSVKTYHVVLRDVRGDDYFEKVAQNALGRILSGRLPKSVNAWLAGNNVASAVDMHRVQQALAFSGRAWLPVDSAAGKIEIKCAQGVPHDCRPLLALSDVPINYPDPALRASFITHVVMHAPPGSVARMANDTSAVIPALEHLGGAPVDTLIARWLDHVRDNNESGFFHGGRLALATIVWTGIFGILAMRSTRWRLG